MLLRQPRTVDEGSSRQNIVMLAPFVVLRNAVTKNPLAQRETAYEAMIRIKENRR